MVYLVYSISSLYSISEIIQNRMESAMSVGGWAEVMRVLKALERLMEATLLCDGESVARGLDKLVGEIMTERTQISLTAA